jgi:hypothetical protein
LSHFNERMPKRSTLHMPTWQWKCSTSAEILAGLKHTGNIWQRGLICWEDWLIEFFCDLFAASTVGSAYGLGHFHLHVGRGGDPFSVPKRSPTEHPADAVRMNPILRALRRLNFSQDVTAVEGRWRQLLSTICAGETAEYHRCFPETLLETIVDKAHQGVQALGCQLAQPGMQESIRKLLNDAWAEFWQTPAGHTWPRLTLLVNSPRFISNGLRWGHRPRGSRHP